MKKLWVFYVWYGSIGSCQNIGDFFNTKGIIQFRTLNELDACLDKATPEYNEIRDAIEDNYERCKKYLSMDDTHANIKKLTNE